MLSLAPDSGLLLVRDEMELWSVHEANLFEDALDKIGKDFAQIREQILPWKHLSSIIELVLRLIFIKMFLMMFLAFCY